MTHKDGGIPQSPASSQPGTREAKVHDSERWIEGWISTEVIDKDNDFVPVKELEKAMPTYMKRGGHVFNRHKEPVGKIDSWATGINPKTNKPGIKVKGHIFSDLKIDDDAWSAIRTGQYQMFSIGGQAKKNKIVCSQTECHNECADIELWESSVVPKGKNIGADITGYNRLAKESGARQDHVHDFQVVINTELNKGDEVMTGDSTPAVCQGNCGYTCGACEPKLSQRDEKHIFSKGVNEAIGSFEKGRISFKKLTTKLMRKGVKDPKSLVAYVELKKQGKKKFLAAAKAGKAMEKEDVLANIMVELVKMLPDDHAVLSGGKDISGDGGPAGWMYFPDIGAEIDGYINLGKRSSTDAAPASNSDTQTGQAGGTMSASAPDVSGNAGPAGLTNEAHREPAAGAMLLKEEAEKAARAIRSALFLIKAYKEEEGGDDDEDDDMDEDGEGEESESEGGEDKKPADEPKGGEAGSMSRSDQYGHVPKPKLEVLLETVAERLESASKAMPEAQEPGFKEGAGPDAAKDEGDGKGKTPPPFEGKDKKDKPSDDSKTDKDKKVEKEDKQLDPPKVHSENVETMADEPKTLTKEDIQALVKESIAGAFAELGIKKVETPTPAPAAPSVTPPAAPAPSGPKPLSKEDVRKSLYALAKIPNERLTFEYNRFFKNAADKRPAEGETQL